MTVGIVSNEIKAVNCKLCNTTLREDEASSHLSCHSIFKAISAKCLTCGKEVKWENTEEHSKEHKGAKKAGFNPISYKCILCNQIVSAENKDNHFENHLIRKDFYEYVGGYILISSCGCEYWLKSGIASQIKLCLACKEFEKLLKRQKE